MAGIGLNPIPYPDDLKDAVWQRKKGVLAKAKKTGIGDLLKKAEAAHKKLDFGKLDPRSNNPKTHAELKKAIDDAKTYYKAAFVPYSAQLQKIVDHAGKVRKENATMLKGAKSGIDDVIKAADHLKVALKSLDLESAAKEVEDRINRRQELAKKFLGDSLKKFLVGAKAFLADPTPDSWGHNIKQQGRSVSNSVKELQDYNKAFWKTFESFKGFDVNTLGFDTDDPAKFTKQSTKLVKDALAEVKKIAAFKPA